MTDGMEVEEGETDATAEARETTPAKESEAK
jgi:hypothetical protein